jgi:hypothetical protein
MFFVVSETRRGQSVSETRRGQSVSETRRAHDEENNQKTFPGCFARSKLQRRWRAGTVLGLAPTGKSLLVLFFRKELLASRFAVSCLPEC